jgi:acetyl-CoA synthetase (ADP-forming)
MKTALGPEETKKLLLKHGMPIPEEGHAAKEEGMEAIITMTRDAELGPIVTFGLAGVFAFIKDVSTKVAPVSREDAIDMIKETEAYDILKGDGKEKKGDIDAVADVIEKVSKMAIENRDIKEIEINPLFIFEKGTSVIETRIMVG